MLVIRGFYLLPISLPFRLIPTSQSKTNNELNSKIFQVMPMPKSID